MNEKSYEAPMFYYWKMIFDLQVIILQFVRSEREREGNFNLYVDVLNSYMKYIFALNHYNYARWFSLHVIEFCNGHFVISKTENQFPSIAIDQTHKQNNAVIKGVGGAVGFLSQDMDAVVRLGYLMNIESVNVLVLK